MLRAVRGPGGSVTRGVVAFGVVLASGLAGWGGSMIALAADDGTPAAESTGPVQAPPTGGPVTSAGTSSAGPSGAGPSSAATTRPDAAPTTAPPPAAAAGGTSPSTSGDGGAAAPIPDEPVRAAGSPEPPRHQGQPDIVFVSPYGDGDETGTGRWYYRVGLLGFPADTVVELSGPDEYGNLRVAPLAMTTAHGSLDPFSQVSSMQFPYGGTCDAAKPATVTARGPGFSVTETAPRPLECDGGTTSPGPWQRPVYPVPPPAPRDSPPRGGSGEG